MGLPGLVGISSSIVDDFHKVQTDVDRKTYRFLRRFGAFVRTSARRSMKPGGAKNKVSKIGEAPRTHGRRFLKNSILFDIPSSKDNVIIGPKLLSGTKAPSDISRTLEEGGIVTGFSEILAAGEMGRDAAGKFVKAKKSKRVKVTRRIAPRPFMGPAFAENKRKLSSIWEGAN